MRMKQSLYLSLAFYVLAMIHVIIAANCNGFGVPVFFGIFTFVFGFMAIAFGCYAIHLWWDQV